MYSGSDRRIHTVFATNNSEYHVRNGVCVAVRDRGTQVWRSNHEAIGMELEVKGIDHQHLGASLLFLSPYYKMQTSKVADVLRPERTAVESYRLLWAMCPR
jgi:hypothetical protein